MSSFFGSLFDRAANLNIANIVKIARSIKSDGGSTFRFCDLGCGDGDVTLAVAEAARAVHIDVIESHPPFLEKLLQYDFAITDADLNSNLPLPDRTYDLVMSNQVIEHLYQTDVFLSEQFRILKPGGRIILSTENAASWHNVFALAMGWQAFSLTNVTELSATIGNPLSLHRGKSGWPFPLQHHRLFATRALDELLALHGFINVELHGAGYHPLPAFFGKFDVFHAHFITVSAEKPR